MSTMPYYAHTAPLRESELVKQEYDPQFCREGFTLLAGSGSDRTIKLGTLLAAVIAAAAITVASAAVAGNTGDGTLTLADPAFTTAVKDGVYVVTCATGGADGASKFRIEGPDGNSIGTATGGTAYTKQIKFTIAGGAADFVEGDSFNVEVVIDQEDAGNKDIAWVPGSGDITGVSLRNVTAPDGADATGLRLVRGPAILAADAILWPSGVTDTQKDNVIEELQKRLIILR